MKTPIQVLVIFILLLAACAENDGIQPQTGTIKGSISSLNEYSVPFEDNSGILVTLKGSDPLLSTYTNSEGLYEILGIPRGTYQLTFTKPGFRETIKQNISIAGGYEPVYVNEIISQTSTTIIQNLEANWISAGTIELRGTVIHNLDRSRNLTTYSPIIRFFIQRGSKPSESNYRDRFTYNFFGESGSQFIITYNPYQLWSDIYIVAHGDAPSSYFDYFLNTYKFPCLGPPSNVVILESFN